MDAACVALTLWLRPWGKVKPVVEEPVVYPHTVETPAAPRAKRFHNVCVKSPERPHKLFGLLPKTLGSCWSSPASLVPAAPVALPPSPLVVKKKKSVRIHAFFGRLPVSFYVQYLVVLVAIAQLNISMSVVLMLLKTLPLRHTSFVYFSTFAILPPSR